jgi:UDP-glucose:(heptosyl)LPS alpha-1,3-glucosyltransferase
VLEFSREGGIERHTWEMVARWKAAHDIHVFAARWSPEASGVTLHRVPTVRISRLLEVPSFFLWSARLIGASSCDVVWNNGGGATGAPGVITAASLHKAWAMEAKKAGLKRFFLNPLHHWTFLVEGRHYRGGRYRKIIAVSEMIKGRLVSTYGVPPQEIEVIYHGVNLDEFNPAGRGELRSRVRRELGLDDEEPVLLFVGKEFRRKGLDFLFQALRAAGGRARLLVVGAGESGRYASLARSMGLGERVRFIGHSADVRRYYAASDLFVFPSTFDAFGMVVLEAMASGLPVVVSPTVGAAELVDHMKDGVVLEHYSDVEGMVRAMRTLLGDPALCGRMGQLARRKAEQYTWDLAAEKTMAVFEAVAAPA